MKIATGIDLVETERFRDLKPEIRDRFYRRVFTPTELNHIAHSFEKAAGIFAAKEAVVKALGCGIGPVSWQEVEILHSPDGGPSALLHGNAARLAGQLNMTQCSISISHTKEHATAVAVAIMEQTESQ